MNTDAVDRIMLKTWRQGCPNLVRIINYCELFIDWLHKQNLSHQYVRSSSCRTYDFIKGLEVKHNITSGAENPISCCKSTNCSSRLRLRSKGLNLNSNECHWTKPKASVSLLFAMTQSQLKWMPLNKTQSFSITSICHETLLVWDYFTKPACTKRVYCMNHGTEFYCLYYLVYFQMEHSFDTLEFIK